MSRVCLERKETQMELTRSTIAGGETVSAYRTDGKLRTAAYCRVSTDLDIQDGSYETQTAYYRSLIQNSPDMEFVEVYGDHGESGRFTENRTGFRRMMEDARNRRFDRLLCKSVSRFARNMSQCIENIRILQSYGISCYFEREALDTADPKSEMLLTILATVAQQESESNRVNIDMARKSRQAEGTPWEKPAYGYRYNKEDASWTVEEHEAGMLHRLFTLALEGSNYMEILEEMKREDPDGGWTKLKVRDRLKNVKCTGDYITGKTYTVTTKEGTKSRTNRGEIEQFYIEGHHPQIISHEAFDTVKEMMERRLLHSRRSRMGPDDEALLEKAKRLAETASQPSFSPTGEKHDPEDGVEAPAER